MEHADIRAKLHAYHAAMVEARTDRLGELVDEAYTLVHITGYVQPRDAWFDVIRTRAFDYHRIDIDDRALSVSVAGGTAVIEGRGIFDATIDGMHAPWRLRFEIACARRQGGWRIVCARYARF